jgi:hypothetical protein
VVCKPVILATVKAEAGGTLVQGQPGQFRETQSQGRKRSQRRIPALQLVMVNRCASTPLLINLRHYFCGIRQVTYFQNLSFPYF